MKHLASTLIFLGFSVQIIFGQTDTIYVDKDWNPCSKDGYKYYRIINKETVRLDNGELIYPVTDYYKSGKLLRTGYYKSIDLETKTYLSTYYKKNGKIKAIELNEFVKYIDSIPLFKSYYDLIDPFVQDSTINFDNSAHLYLSANKNNKYNTIYIRTECTGSKVKFYKADTTIKYILSFINRRSEGKLIEFNKDGITKKEAYFKDGDRHGPYRNYHNNGLLRYENYYYFNRAIGPRKHFRKNGKIKSIYNYDNGPRIRFWKNGEMRSYREFVNGKLDGLVVHFNKEGHARTIEKYTNGIKYEEKAYNEGSGDLIRHKLHLNSDYR